jgi:hypothetical protein
LFGFTFHDILGYTSEDFLRLNLRFLALTALALGTALLPAPARAQGFTVTLRFDENCHGTLTNSNNLSAPLPCSFQADPGPGGLPAALFYDLLTPPGLVGGDLVVLENADLISDIIRWDPTIGTGGMFVYSDISDLSDGDLADTGFPGGLNTNLVRLFEVGPEGDNGITYTPTQGQPGFVAGAAGPVTYIFISDAPVPEPASAGLILLGGATVFFARRKLLRSKG